MAYDNPRPSSQPVGSTDQAVAKDNLITLDKYVVGEESVIPDRKGNDLLTLAGIQEAAEIAIDNAVYSIGFQNVGVFEIGATVESSQDTLTYNSEEYNTTAGPFPVTVDAATPDLDSEDWFNVTLEGRKTAAISLNTPLANVTYDTAGGIVAGYIISESQEVIYSVPASAAGKTIDNVLLDQLTTTDTSVYTLIAVVGSDSELKSIARSLNILDSEVIYSTDTTTVLDDVLYIYDSSPQTTRGMPTLESTGKTIVSVVGDDLTTTGGSGSDTYKLLPIDITEDQLTVAEMLTVNASLGDRLHTTFFNAEIRSDWEVVASGAGDLTDGTLLMDNGLYALLLSRGNGDPLEFGAYGDKINIDNDSYEKAKEASKLGGLAAAVIHPSPTSTGYRLTTGLDIASTTLKGDAKSRLRLYFDDEPANCLITDGFTNIEELFIDGGWDGSTPGLVGDIINAGKATFTAQLHMRNVRLINARRDAIAMSNIGYSSLVNVNSNASGRHGLHLDGQALGNCTTVSTYSCVFSDTPNGYGVRQYDGHNITHTGLISEFTDGYQFSGSQMRATAIMNYYNEFGAATDYITLSGSGIGLSITGGFGGGKVITPSNNYFDFFEAGTSNLIRAAIQKNDEVYVIGTETVIVATGAVSYTLAEAVVGPGSWDIWGVLQTANVSSAVYASAFIHITDDETDTGQANATNNNFAFGAAQDTSPGTATSLRLDAFETYHNNTGGNKTIYLRSSINLTSGQYAYKGALKAQRVK